MATERLAGLLAELARASSPLQKARILARGWRAVRRLDAAELRELASTAGFDGAQELLARLADRRGLDRRLLAELLRRLATVDSATVEDRAAALRDPRRQGTPPGQGPQIVSSKVEQDPGAAETPRAGPLAPPSRAVPASIDETDSAGVPAAVAPTAVAPKTPAPEEEPATRAASDAPAVRGSPESAIGSAVAPAAAALEPVVNASTPGLSENARPPIEQRPDRRADPRPGALLLRRIADAPSLIARFRLLRADLELARSLGADELAQLIRAFPPGWARRRALATLLRARIPHEPGVAAALIESLASPVARRWCARTLLHCSELPASDRGTISERFGLTRPAGLPRRASRIGAGNRWSSG